MTYYMEKDSPVGVILLESDGTALTGLWIGREPSLDGIREECPVLFQAAAWLDDYFQGQPQPFGFPLEPKGTPFQKMIWEILLTIPFGKTRTYGDIAREVAGRLGKGKMSAQAVGGAVGSNPISILIPCHRVVGAKGQLTGYAWGLEKKEWLLRHEGYFLLQRQN